MVKKIFKILAILLITGLIVIQFFRIDQSNPAVVSAETMENAISVPENVRSILDRSCADCHSHNSVYPWYSNVQPVGWFLRDHIDEARKELNLSVYNTYTLKKKAHKLEEVCEQVEKKEMPLPSYLWIHRDAALSDIERKTLCDWANAEKAKLDTLIAVQPSN